jgi:hypothetical protein
MRLIILFHVVQRVKLCRVVLPLVNTPSRLGVYVLDQLSILYILCILFVKDRFYEELERVFDKFLKYHKKILLGYFNAKVRGIYFQTNNRE